MTPDKALPAFRRAARRYAALLARSGGNPADAASRLWQRSRHDPSLREDLVKAACLTLALARGGDAGADEAPHARRRAPRSGRGP